MNSLLMLYVNLGILLWLFGNILDKAESDGIKALMVVLCLAVLATFFVLAMYGIAVGFMNEVWR